WSDDRRPAAISRGKVALISLVSRRSLLAPRDGRRALQLPAKVDGQRPLEVLQVIMPERVTIKRVRIPFAESLRFPGEGKSAQGESDPKARPKGVVDGRQVNIPAPRWKVESARTLA